MQAGGLNPEILCTNSNLPATILTKDKDSLSWQQANMTIALNNDTIYKKLFVVDLSNHGRPAYHRTIQQAHGFRTSRWVKLTFVTTISQRVSQHAPYRYTAQK